LAVRVSAEFDGLDAIERLRERLSRVVLDLDL
jgi:hypothetical protein